MATTTSTPRIPAIYRIYFLTIEPLMALSGAYLCLFQPTRFITSTVPSTTLRNLSVSPSSSPSSLSATITPLTQLLLTNLASLYILFTINEAVVLRVTKEIAVWKAVVFSMVCADLGHLWAVVQAGGFDEGVGGWVGEEWVNVGILVLGLGLRVGFLCGLGVGR
ncbi:hypothetical protein F5884DRAFT_740347 [Xylogone sp. PMI_703]|nr:hypothetical protein F5884DRAFT_740347 [Xylogone sp. PMI_703]